MAKSTISLDFKANTAKALAGFRNFSDDLTNKFLISGLKLDLMKDAIANINREFDNALGQQGLNSATELKQIESSAGAVFSVLKGGSLEAGREMAKNIRMALGDVSKSLGSTTEDINSVMKMIPVTSKSMLDAYGITMEDFASMNLRMITNARDAFGEDASKLIEGILSGQTDISALNADQTGIGQLIRQRLPGQDFSAMSQEMRTSAVLRLLQDSEFQSQIEGIAEDNAGFMRTFRSFKNVLFDSRTGIFGMLKEVTVELRDFSGNKSTETTSIFKEINRLYKVLFSPEEGVFAALGKVIAEAFNLDGDSIAGILVKLVRFITNLINGIIPLIESDVFRGFIDIIGNIFKFFSGIIQGLIGIGSFDFDSNSFIESINEFVNSFTNFILGGMDNIIEYFNNLSFDGVGLLNNIESLVINISDAIGNIFLKGFETITAVIGGILRNFGGWENIGLSLMTLIQNVTDNFMLVMDGFFEMLMSDEIDLAGFVDVGLDVLTMFANQIVQVIERFISNFDQLKSKLFPNGFEEFGRELGKIIVKLMPSIIEMFSEVMTPIKEILKGLFSEILKAFGFSEPFADFLADIITNLTILFDPGGIISKILGQIPILGGVFTKIYEAINWINTTLGNVAGGAAGGAAEAGTLGLTSGALGKATTTVVGTSVALQGTDVVYDTLEEIDEGQTKPEDLIKESIRKGTGRSGGGGWALSKGWELIDKNTGISADDIANDLGLNPKYKGNIPQEIKRAAGGMNLIANMINEERANTRPGIKPVIANSDEIIIPPGRLAEVQITSANQINTTLMNFFAQMMSIFSGGMGGSKALTGDFLNIFFSDLEKDTEDVWTESKDKNTDFYKELERDIETKWRPSLNRINQSLNNLEVPSLSLPSLVIPDISIPEIKSEDINIEGDWTEVVGEGWDRVKNFFDNAGQSAEELTQGPIKSIYDNLKNASNWFGGLFSGGNNNNNDGPDYMGDMTPITNAYNGISQAISLEKSMTSPGTGIIIANQNEIVAPPNRLLELTDNLLARSNVNKNNSTRENINNNTFNIEINASNISNPRELANEIRKALNEEYSKYAATILIPNT